VKTDHTNSVIELTTPTDGRSKQRKFSGTGIHDTPVTTWNAMRAEFIHSTEPLTDIARRHGVIYSAVHAVRMREHWNELRPPAPPRPPLRATPSRPACPGCGAGSTLYRIRVEGVMAFRCSGCGHLWERRCGGPQLQALPGGKE